MNAAEISASSAIAPWTSLTVVSRSLTTAEIDTFISDVSTTRTNMAIASSSDSRVACGWSATGAVGGLAQHRVVELVRLRGAAEPDQDRLHGDEVVDRGDHPDRGLAFAERGGQPLAIGVVESEVLVVQLAEQSAAGRPDSEADGPEQPEGGADRQALDAARGADLVRLELAVIVKDEYGERVVVERAGIVEGAGGL